MVNASDSVVLFLNWLEYLTPSGSVNYTQLRRKINFTYLNALHRDLRNHQVKRSSESCGKDCGFHLPKEISIQNDMDYFNLA